LADLMVGEDGLCQKHLENAVFSWDAPRMRVSTDDRCRLQSRELFKPNTRYEGELAADGSIRLMELVEKPVPVVKIRRQGGFVLVDTKLDREAIRAAIRADRDSR
jgi:hypothetical protein